MRSPHVQIMASYVKCVQIQWGWPLRHFRGRLIEPDLPAGNIHLRGHGQFVNLPQPSQKCRLPLPGGLCDNFKAIHPFPPQSWNSLGHSLNPSSIKMLPAGLPRPGCTVKSPGKLPTVLMPRSYFQWLWCSWQGVRPGHWDFERLSG